MERLPPLINILGLPFATLSPITLIPGNFPVITSSSVIAAGDIERNEEGLEKLFFGVPQLKIKINNSK